MLQCAPSGLDLFSIPPINTSVLQITNQPFFPVSGVAPDTNTFDFVVAANNPEVYLDLALSRLHLKIRVETQSGENIPTGKDVSLIPLWPQALFKQTDLYLGSKLVSSSTNLYAYRSYLETLLSFSKEAKEEQLNILSHYKGDALAADSRPRLQAYIPLHLDMFQQDRYLLNAVDLRLRLIRQEDTFLLKTVDATNKYRIVIEEIALFMCKVTVSTDILTAHARLLGSRRATYPLNRVWLRSYNLITGSQDALLTNVFLGGLPRRIIIGMIRSDAFNGSLTENPFNFQPFGLSHISCLVNAVQVPLLAFEPDFPSKHVCREYYHLLQTVMGACTDQQALGISLKEYTHTGGNALGKTLFGFLLQPDVEGGPADTLSPIQQGNMDLRLKFKTALTLNVTVIVYAEFLNSISIDSNRNVYTDFGN
jgi:hypothetical protein